MLVFSIDVICQINQDLDFDILKFYNLDTAGGSHKLEDYMGGAQNEEGAIRRFESMGANSFEEFHLPGLRQGTAHGEPQHWEPWQGNVEGSQIYLASSWGFLCFVLATYTRHTPGSTISKVWSFGSGKMYDSPSSVNPVLVCWFLILMLSYAQRQLSRSHQISFVQASEAEVNEVERTPWKGGKSKSISGKGQLLFIWRMPTKKTMDYVWLLYTVYVLHTLDSYVPGRAGWSMRPTKAKSLQAGDSLLSACLPLLSILLPSYFLDWKRKGTEQAGQLEYQGSRSCCIVREEGQHLACYLRHQGQPWFRDVARNLSSPNLCVKVAFDQWGKIGPGTWRGPTLGQQAEHL